MGATNKGNHKIEDFFKTASVKPVLTFKDREFHSMHNVGQNSSKDKKIPQREADYLTQGKWKPEREKLEEKTRAFNETNFQSVHVKGKDLTKSGDALEQDNADSAFNFIKGLESSNGGNPLEREDGRLNILLHQDRSDLHGVEEDSNDYENSGHDYSDGLGRSKGAKPLEKEGGGKNFEDSNEDSKEIEDFEETNFVSVH